MDNKNRNSGMKNDSIFRLFFKNIRTYPITYLMAIPVLAYYLIFHYGPMYGLIIAFKDYVPRKGVFASEWVGFTNFIEFFTGPYFYRTVRNTLLLSFYQLLYGFPAPILFALLLNEVRNGGFKKTIQTISYLPHFISIVVLAGIIVDFCQITGLFNDIIVFLGGNRTPLLSRPELFRTIYVGSGIWQELGYGSIVYLAALSSVDQQLYEAASIDGAGRLRQTWNVTLPGIAPTIMTMLLLRIGRMMSLGYEKIILLYSSATYETADIISSYVYRRGFLAADYSYGSAVDLFNSVINLFLLLISNGISRKLTETSIF